MRSTDVLSAAIMNSVVQQLFDTKAAGFIKPHPRIYHQHPADLIDNRQYSRALSRSNERGANMPDRSAKEILET